MKILFPALMALALTPTGVAQTAPAQKWEYGTIAIEFTFRSSGDSTVYIWQDAKQKIYFENKKGLDGTYKNSMPIEEFWARTINNGKTFSFIQVAEWAVNEHVPFLNEMGNVGWELIDIVKKKETFEASGVTLDSTKYFFKRPLIR